jgi:hypothetical protein
MCYPARMDAAAKFRRALEMQQEGIAMHRLTLQRRYPTCTTLEIDAKLQSWLLDRPDAPHGDGVGTPREVFGTLRRVLR